MLVCGEVFVFKPFGWEKNLLEAAKKKPEENIREYLRREAVEKQTREIEDAVLAHLTGKEKKTC